MKQTIGVIDINSIKSAPFPKTDMVRIDLSGTKSILVDGITIRYMEGLIKKQDEIYWSYDDKNDCLFLRSETEDSSLEIKLNGF